MVVESICAVEVATDEELVIFGVEGEMCRRGR